MALFDFFPDDVNPNVDPEVPQVENESPPLSEIDTGPADTDFGAGIQRFDDGSFIQTFDDGSVITGDATGDLKATPIPAENPYNQFNTGTFTGALFNTGSSNEEVAAALRDQARQQQTIANQRRQINNGDWRVRLRLAPAATYLYKAANPGIMQPLAVTDGIIFPYTPAIDTVYRAEYDQYALTHSNYKGYFYKSSFVDPVTVRATFTAQSTAEANYLLAVITFLKSATKMFYGQDAERGAPPPLVYLSGLGDYQFNEHSCVISQFNFNLPPDVDYIRAGSPDNVGLNLATQRDRQTVSPIVGLAASVGRLISAGLSSGALPNPLAPPTLGLNRPTYVPSKMEITISLLPVQSRKQVSKQFSVKEFANGNLIKGGFW